MSKKRSPGFEKKREETTDDTAEVGTKEEKKRKEYRGVTPVFFSFLL